MRPCGGCTRGTNAGHADRAEEITKAAGLNASGSAAANRFRCIRAWWRWCAKKGWCDADTITPIDAPRTANEDEVSTLTPAEVRALLTTAEKHHPEAVASIVLLAFADELLRQSLDKTIPMAVNETPAEYRVTEHPTHRPAA